MPKSKKLRRATGRENSQMARINIDPSVTRYLGPSRLPQDAVQNRTDVILLRSLLVVSSSAGGVIDQVVDNNPSGYQDWTSVAALWDDYRVLSLLIEYFPYNRYSKTTTNCKPWYSVFDRDSTGALSSLNAAVQYESCKQVSVEDPWSREIKMSDVTDAGFITTASPSATFCMKGYQNGYSASTSYGEFFVSMLVQVRGRN